MGQSSNEALNTYPSLTFSPPLESTITVTKPRHIPVTPYLRWQATLGREDYDRLCSAKGEIHVWSNCTGGQWSATPFARCTTLNAPKEGVKHVDLSLFECSTETTENQVSLEASIPVPSSVGPMVEFTYRVVYASGSTDWLGTNETNAKVDFSSVEEDDCLKAGNWVNEGDGAAFLWTCVVHEPMVIDSLGSSADWNGWAFKKESTGSSDISHIVGVTSESSTGPVIALALLPRALQGACVVYSSVLYTVQHGTLSLEGNNVLLYPGEGGMTKLNAYPLTSTWKDHIPHKPALLDIQTSDFLGVSLGSRVGVGHLHFLPVTGAQSIITLNPSDTTSLPPWSSVLLFDPSLRAIKFLPALSPTERLRVAMGPVGGEIIVVPAYTLSPSISMAFLHDQESVTELEENPCYHSEHSPSSEEFASESSDCSAESIRSSPDAVFQMRPNGHSSMLSALRLLVVYMFQYFWAVLFSTDSPISPSVRTRERVAHTVPSPQDVGTFPRLAFKVIGKSPLLVTGKDASKVRIIVGGKLLQMTPKDIGGGHWLIETTSELETDRGQRRIEILLRD